MTCPEGTTSEEGAGSLEECNINLDGEVNEDKITEQFFDQAYTDNGGVLKKIKGIWVK